MPRSKGKAADDTFRADMARLIAERHERHVDGFAEAWAKRMAAFADEPPAAIYSQSSRCAHTPACAIAKEVS